MRLASTSPPPVWHLPPPSANGRRRQEALAFDLRVEGCLSTTDPETLTHGVTGGHLPFWRQGAPIPVRVHAHTSIKGPSEGSRMCGRVIQSSLPLQLAIVHGMNVAEGRASNYPRRFNAAPSQDLLVIRRNRDTGEVSLDPLRWGLIPYWCKDPKGDRKPINAKAETVARLPMFRDAYARRRCILPVDREIRFEIYLHNFYASGRKKSAKKAADQLVSALRRVEIAGRRPYRHLRVLPRLP